MNCSICGQNILHCPHPASAKELEQADKEQERNRGYKPSYDPNREPDKSDKNNERGNC